MPDPRSAARTDAGLASELRLSVMRLRRRLAAEREPGNDLSLPAMAVLGLLYRAGEQNVGDLARAERVRPPSMTRTVNCLAEAGYVVRVADPDDGRRVVVALSDRGRDVVLADRRRRDAWLTRRLTELPAEDREVLRRAAPLLHDLSRAD